MSYSLKIGLTKALKRGLTVGVFAGLGTIAAVFLDILPAEYQYIAPLITAVMTSFEKFERNYREN